MRDPERQRKSANPALMARMSNEIDRVYRLLGSRQAIYRTVVLTIAISPVLCFFSPLQLQFPQSGLDPSWRLALVQARIDRLLFGSQVVFTGGPLSHVYTHLYDKSLMSEKFLAAAIFILFFVAVFLQAMRINKNALVVFVASLPLVFNLFDDPIYLGIPLAAFFAIASPQSELRKLIVLLLGVAAAAVITLAKFSILPMALVAFALVDIVALSQRRAPICLIAYAACVMVVFALTSPDASLPNFIRASFDVASGYAEAMGTPGSARHILPVLALATGCFATILAFERRSRATGDSTLLISSCRILCVTTYLFICIKAGLVRHGVHQAITWYGISFAAAVYFVFRASPSPLRASHSLRKEWLLRPSFLLAFVFAGFCGAQLWLSSQGVSTNRDLLVRQLLLPYERMSQWIDFIKNPKSWLDAQETMRAEAIKRVRIEQPLLPLKGTVDAIPSIQAALIANGLAYHPRPTIQEYTTYTKTLIEKDRAFFTGDSAPDYLLMTPGAIDGRHPASAEGALWPLFLSLYAPSESIGNLILLKKRDHPIAAPMRQIRADTISLNAPIMMDALASRAVFSKIDVQPTFAGRLATFLFKSAMLYIDVEYIDGAKASYRIIPAMAREGFFISPLIENSIEYLALSIGLQGAIPHKVQSFAVRTEGWGRWLWRSTAAVTLAVLDDQPIRDATNLQELPSNIRQRIELLRLLSQNQPKPTAGMIPDGLLAHAPTQLKLETKGRKSLEISFGVLDSAWQKDAKTDGVCFRVVSEKEPTALYERCLDPRETMSDRGLQTAEIALPDVSSLSLETTCRIGCGWGWSYWSRVSLK